MKIRKYVQIAAAVVFFVCMLSGCYILPNMPPQELKITAVTRDREYDVQGVTDVWYLKPLGAGQSHKAVIRFMAVEDTSDELFTQHGTGQFVFYGCSELEAGHEFMSIGRFLKIRLTMNVVQADLKLEDGTPFDITRYSLKPVIMIEE